MLTVESMVSNPLQRVLLLGNKYTVSIEGSYYYTNESSHSSVKLFFLINVL